MACTPLHQPPPPRLQPPPQTPQQSQQPPAHSIEDLFEDLEQVDFTPLAPAASAARAVADVTAGTSADVSASSDSAKWLVDGSEEPTADSGGSSDEGDGDQATELIFRLERRGDGWGEEIFPHITVENRPLEKKQRIRPRSNQPDPWEEGSLEEFLAALGVPHEKVDETVQAAIVWRVTPAGRPLIDRRRRSRVERNVRSVTGHLIEECGLSKEEVARLLMDLPQVLLCKPSHNDRFDRRVVSLAAFRFRFGHVNVPQDWEEMPELAPWMARMRVSRAQGIMSAERQQILEGLGFEFGEVAQITDDWEVHFDQLLDWLLWLEGDDGPNLGQSIGWCGADWGSRGGRTARELALWVQLQRELRRRGLLQPVAEHRLNAIGMQWQPEDCRPEDREWMSRLGRVMFLVERTRRTRSGDVAAVVDCTAEQEREPLRFEDLLRGRPPATADVDAMLQRQKRHAPPAPARKVGRPTLQRSGGAGAMTTAEVVAERRAALRLAQLEPGIGYWLAKQRWLWRHNRLPQERLAMLLLAGVDMDTTSPADWLQQAHATARFVTGGCCAAAPPPAWPQQPQPCAGGQQHQQQQQDAAHTQQSNGHSLAPGNGASPTQRGVQQQEQGRPGAAAEQGQAAGNSTQQQLDPPGWGGFQPSPVAVRRWVLTQKVLVEQRRLSSAQFRYLTMLGITWMLSDQVVAMRPSLWAAQYERLAQAAVAAPAARPALPMAALREWLAHQKGLRALGLLAPRQTQLLEQLGVQWQRPLTASEARWAACFAHLVAFARRHGHCQVPKDIGVLASWLGHQMALWRAGQLPATRQAQLRALGAALGPDPAAATAAAGAASTAAGPQRAPARRRPAAARRQLPQQAARQS